MKKIIIITGLLLAVLGLGGCQSTGKEAVVNSAVVQKSGILKMKSGDDYLLSTDEGIINITSNKVKLDDYLTKKIKVTGMFSGSILYVDKVE